MSFRQGYAANGYLENRATIIMLTRAGIGEAIDASGVLIPRRLEFAVYANTKRPLLRGAVVQNEFTRRCLLASIMHRMRFVWILSTLQWD